MVYNEPELLPIWGRHYARQVGADHCYVVDHGSTDPITAPLGTNVIRLPRSPHDDDLRAEFISQLAAALLKYHDWVLYTDVDELIVADPRKFRNIPEFCNSLGEVGTVTAIGLDVQHVPSLEATLDVTQGVGNQRGWARFTSAMCKPVLTRRPLVWSPGFHCSDSTLSFADLYLFHLHWVDQQLGLKRLEKTRDMPWAGDHFGAHQRLTNAMWLAMFGGMAELPRREDISFEANDQPIRAWLEKTADSSRGRKGQLFSIDLNVNAGELWSIPDYFRACF